ncbi:hypothetical protein Bealeia2_01900 (plasmid) [Candidatus Bealeia paramacronuclearis]|nr:hypothetical protein [Candidatus Bealeia paramacronuclearis]
MTSPFIKNRIVLKQKHLKTHLLPHVRFQSVPIRLKKKTEREHTTVFLPDVMDDEVLKGADKMALSFHKERNPDFSL